MKHGRIANQLVRRAKQFSDLGIIFRPIHPAELSVIGHGGAGLKNAEDLHTQGGFIIGFTERKVRFNEAALYTPATWKSYKMRRVCSATLAAESQVAMDMAGHVEWTGSLLCEALDPGFDLTSRQNYFPCRTAAAVTGAGWSAGRRRRRWAARWRRRARSGRPASPWARGTVGSRCRGVPT